MTTELLTGTADSLMPAALIVLKATVILLLGLALTSIMSRASATSRHLVWTASLLALLAIPPLALWSPIRFAVLPSSWGLAPVAASVLASTADSRRAHELNAPRAEATASRAEPRSDETPTRMTTPVSPDAGTAAAAPPSAAMLLLAGWGAVAASLLAWLVVGAFAVRRITRSAEPLDDAAWQGMLMEVADRLGLASIPTLLRSSTVTMPFACGFRSPAIVLPAHCDSWTPERRLAVLLHELAHIRRRDIVGHTVGRVVCALYWFHPLAWTAAKRLRAESERACDDLALSCGTRASDYAEHLLEIVTSVRVHTTPSVAMAMASRSEFEGRMLAILDPSLMRAAPTRMQASTLAGAVMMFAIVAGSATPRVAPPDGSNQRAIVAEADADTVLQSTTRAELPSAVAAGNALAVRASRDEASVSVPSALDMSRDVATREDGDEQSSATDDARPSSPRDSSARALVLARILRTDTNPSLRRTAAWGLNDHTDDQAAREALLNAVRRDASADVREMAAWALADAADRSDVVTVLADVIRDERNAGVRASAVWSLGDGANGGSREAVTALTDVLGDADAQLRELAAWGIGNIEPSRAPSRLIDMLGDGTARVRATAAWALFQIEDATAADALEAALQKEGDTMTKQAMVRAISVMGERAVAPLQRIIEGSDTELRSLAIKSLASQGGSGPWPKPRPRPRPYP